MRAPGLGHFLAVVVLLGVVATVAPLPDYPTDRDRYQDVGRHVIVLDCPDLHCFRVLVAVALEHLPGPSLVKWKAFAVLANAAAALAVARLCIVGGLSAQAAGYAFWLSAFGAGALFTLFDCYSSDPLMYLLGPLISTEILQGRRRAAFVMSAIGVFAKEFAAFPLVLFTVVAAMQRRWQAAVPLALASGAVILIWLGWHTFLMAGFNYTYGETGVYGLSYMLHGGFLGVWLSKITPALAAVAVLNVFGALYLLLPFGLKRVNAEWRWLAAASVPAALALSYVQQPDRALWNFHFIVVPIAAVMLEDLPAWLASAFIVLFAWANLRLGAQLTFIVGVRAAVLLTVVIAVAAIVMAWRRGRRTISPSGSVALG